jgi:hypothetical protein
VGGLKAKGILHAKNEKLPLKHFFFKIQSNIG